MKKTWLKLSTFAFAMAVAGTAFAGQKGSYPVVVSTGSHYAFGSLGTARNSADTVQYIGCYVTGTTAGGMSGGCVARDAAGIGASCSTSNSSLLQVMLALPDHGLFTFNWDAAGACTAVQLQNYSTYEPLVK